MSRMIIRGVKLLFILLLLLQSNRQSILAQTVTLGSGYADELYRIAQVAGWDKSNASFALRPLVLNDTSFFAKQDSARVPAFIQQMRSWYTGKTIWKKQGKNPYFSPSVKLLPIDWVQQYNTKHPYGWNDGAMVPARGYQTLIRGGVYAEYGPLTIQLRPEVVIAQNRDFETFPTEHAQVTWQQYYYFLNRIDNPERFGTGVYTKVLPGQSSIKFNYKSLSLGVSTENLWWGPGVRNSLVMSNNASGFLHASFNSNRPVKTPVGSFEWQLIGGKLENSGILPPETNRGFYSAKLEDTRYINALLVTVQPKWTPGLYLGLSRVFTKYSSKVSNSFFYGYMPVLSGIFKNNKYFNANAAGENDQMGTFFIRQVLPKEKAEIYFEFGRNDFAVNLRDFLMEPEHARAYILGARKLFELKKNRFLEIHIESTQLGNSKTAQLRQLEGWYHHYQVRHGYTHRGQILGAGIGSGAESQSLYISLLNKKSRFGILFERYVHQNDFYYLAFVATRDFRRHWVDLSTTFHADVNYKKFMLSAKLGIIRSLNYQWWYVDVVPLTSPQNYFRNGYDVLNYHLRISASYRL